MKRKLLGLLLSVAMVATMFTGCGSKASNDNLVGVAMPAKDLQRWNQDGSNMKEQ